jgi:hypothetical protein
MMKLIRLTHEEGEAGEVGGEPKKEIHTTKTRETSGERE